MANFMNFPMFADVKLGDQLVADSGFDCLDDGQVVTVKRDKNGLFVACRRGRHHLDGQVNEAGKVSGLCAITERAAWAQRQTDAA